MRTRFETRRILVVVALALLGLAAASCSDDPGTTPAAGTTQSGIDASLKDFGIAISRTAADSGDVSFSIENEGPSTHEFVVIRSDTPPDQLPVEDGLVPEDGIDLMGEAEDIAPATTVELTLDLQPGSYIVMCNVAGHYERGMHAGFTVG